MVLCLILVAPSGYAPKEPCRFLNTDPVYSAHRGYVENHQENTIGAILASFTNWSGRAEFDIMLTKDEQLVVFHDYTTTRMTGVDKNVKDMTLAEMQALPLVTDLNDKKWGTPGKIPSYKEVLEAICTSGNEDRQFVVDLNFADNPPGLSGADKLMAELAISELADSPCTSKDVIFTIGHPSQGPVMRAKMSELKLSNPISFWLVPDTWPLGEHFWIQSRFLFYHAGATMVELHDTLWAEHQENILKLQGDGYCVGVFGSNANKYEKLANYPTLDVDEESWKKIGDKSYDKPPTYTGGSAAYGGIMFFTILMTVLTVVVLPYLLWYTCKRMSSSPEKVAPE
jgi:glycerophosphoryl diester phosphodiesterase